MRLKKQYILLFIFSVILSGMISTKSSNAQVKIGVFADCQYCDCETAGNRYYRNSLSKLGDCISEFNQITDIEFVVGLGDLIDRDFKSFEKVNSILATSKTEVFHVSGNHDFSVEDEFIDMVPAKLNLEKTYYSINKNSWQFIFLNGNEISFQSTNAEVVAQAEKTVAKLTAENKPNHHKWNGGMSETQINWLKKQLTEAERENRKVVLFCHYPLLPYEAHALWNAEELLPILSKYPSVKAWINGHNHAGNYVMKDGIHFITFRGMVDTESQNAYAVVSFTEEQIVIHGYGREVSRNLPVK